MAPLFLGKWCGVATYFFIQKNKKNKYTLHDQNTCHLLNKEKYNFGKLTLQGFGS